MQLPCFKCILCRKERSKEWTKRLLWELCSHQQSLYITLTYATEHLPKGQSLEKREAQLFIKKLRQNLSTIQINKKSGRKKRYFRNIKYYLTGEYGDEGGRPHYHAILFNVGLSDLKNIEKSWQKGNIHHSGVGIESIQYVTGYITKKLFGTQAEERYHKLNLQEPFSLMSNNIGLKESEKSFNQMLKNGFITINGIKMSIPKYLVNKFDKLKEPAKMYVAKKHKEELRLAKKMGLENYKINKLNYTEQKSLSATLSHNRHVLTQDSYIKPPNRKRLNKSIIEEAINDDN